MKQTRVTIDTNRRIVVSRAISLEGRVPVTGANCKSTTCLSTDETVEPPDRLSGSGARGGALVPTKEEFDCLLAYLSPDREEAGKEYETLRRKLIKLFQYRGCHSPEELADETINRIAKKIKQGAEI